LAPSFREVCGLSPCSFPFHFSRWKSAFTARTAPHRCSRLRPRTPFGVPPRSGKPKGTSCSQVALIFLDTDLFSGEIFSCRSALRLPPLKFPCRPSQRSPLCRLSILNANRSFLSSIEFLALGSPPPLAGFAGLFPRDEK